LSTHLRLSLRPHRPFKWALPFTFMGLHFTRAYRLSLSTVCSNGSSSFTSSP
jgi:hypothetical protein